MNHIEKHASVIFLPEQPHKTRVRDFGICNTLDKFFAQAYQAKLFAQKGSLGRLLEIKISGLDEAIGIVEGDQEDFQDFVRDLKRAPCWKLTEAGMDGECKVEVRLQML